VSTKASPPHRDKTGLLADIVRELRLVWRLLRDRRVPFWTKLVPLATVFYLLFPLDLVSDLLVGLGQLDDLAIIFLGLELFISLSPAAVVEEIRRELRFGQGWGEVQQQAQTVDSTARPVDQVPPRQLPGGEQ